MSRNDEPSDYRPRLITLPTFDLSYDFDDADEPTRVTIYSGAENEIRTHWISIEAAYAVPLVDVA